MRKDQFKLRSSRHILLKLTVSLRGKLETKSAFVAVSHVWAHGRGNPRLNDLPRCQIELLQVIPALKLSNNGHD